MGLAQQEVRTLIRRPAVEISGEETLRAVAETLTEESVGVVVVRSRRTQSGILLRGLLSERDVVQALGAGMDPDTTRAEDVMTGDLACARADEPIVDAALRMLDNEIRHLPVVEHDAVIGVISARDALQALVEAGRPREP